ncbi:MAG: aminopeptidase [Nanoarchaeota archaeon]|nr:aminopeptidase [Nanoarchaeota archaeon]MCG2717896.1 aminopeptidase [Nanoarchaeota archaeon]
MAKTKGDLEEKLKEIERIEEWGESKLGLPKSNNFRSYDGKLMTYHLVYYTHPLRLPTYYWDMGRKNFEEEKNAIKFKREAESKGYDVHYRTSEALAGKPEISNYLLEKSMARKAYTVFHENMHNHIWMTNKIKQLVDLEEACANIAGYYGAKEYTLEMFGKDSTEYEESTWGIKEKIKKDRLVIKYYQKLDNLLKLKIPENQKLLRKEKLLAEFVNKKSILLGYEVSPQNNASFASDITYSRYMPLVRKVYHKTRRTKKAIQVFKTMSEIVDVHVKSYDKISKSQTDDAKELCLMYLESYIDS